MTKDTITVWTDTTPAQPLSIREMFDMVRAYSPNTTMAVFTISGHVKFMDDEGDRTVNYNDLGPGAQESVRIAAAYVEVTERLPALHTYQV